MENNINNNINQESGAKTPENNTNKNDIVLPQTAEELQAMLQRESDRRVTEARKKFEADFNAKLEKEKTEAARLAKLTKAEKEQEEFNRQKQEFEAQKAEFHKSQLLNQTMVTLQQESLPVNFAEYFMADSAEQIQENIKIFKQAWQEAIQKEVDNRLTTKTPKKGTQTSNIGMSFFDAIKQNKIR